jgi:putative peptidoglycan lipid II flippase
MHWRLAWDPADAHLREIGRSLLPISCSAGLPFVGLVLDTAFASTAAQAAAVPAVYNAWLVFTLPHSMLGKSLGQSVFPRLAQSVAAADWGRALPLFLRTIGAAVGLAVPAAIALLVFGRSIVGVLFEHGRFDTAAADLTYRVLAVYATAIPAAIATEMLTRGLLAMRNTRVPLIADLGQVVARAGIMLVLVPRVGVVAIPFAFATTSLVEAAVLAGVLFVGLRCAQSLVERQPSLVLVE